MMEEREVGGTRLFQITEPDLADLERLVPILSDQLTDQRDTPRYRAAIRRAKEILSDVRWNYGPLSQIERIEPGDAE